MLKLTNVNKRLGKFHLKNVNFEVDEGDYFVLLGESGAGKSVLLEIIAGLVKPDLGKITIHERDITFEKIQNRKVGIVFQDFSVFPHMTVRQNIEYSLRSRKEVNKHRNLMVEEYAQLTNISHLLDRNITNLSGGELQRVALARTLIAKPDCLLLDEPLASLDVQLREDLRYLLKKINRQGTTILHVTHDFEEALALSNKVALIKNGTIIQCGDTREILAKPVNEFVAKFIGIKNYFHVSFTTNGVALTAQDIKIKMGNSPSSGRGTIIIEPESICVFYNHEESEFDNMYPGTVKYIIRKLKGFEVIVDSGIHVSISLTDEKMLELNLVEENEIWIGFDRASVRIIS